MSLPLCMCALCLEGRFRAPFLCEKKHVVMGFVRGWRTGDICVSEGLDDPIIS